MLCAGWADSAALPVEEPEKLTELGRKLTQYPVLPRLGVMLVKAMELGVLVPVVAVVAALSVQVSGSSLGLIILPIFISETTVCAQGLAQPRAWSAGDVCAEYCLQCEAGELAGVTRARQARPLSACTTH